MTNDKRRDDFLYFLYPAGPELPADERYFHDDIPRMNNFEVQRELARALHRLGLDPRPSEWLLERIDRLREALDHAHAN